MSDEASSDELSCWERAVQTRARYRAGTCGGCFSFVCMYVWVCVLIALTSLVFGGGEQLVQNPDVLIVFNESSAGACAVGDNTTCAAAQQNVWRQFTTIVRGMDSTGALRPTQQGTASECEGVNISPPSTAGGSPSTPGGSDASPRGSGCSSCMCQRLEQISSSSIATRCGVSSVLDAMRDQQTKLAALKQAGERFEQLQDAGSLMDGLGTDACRGCNVSRCTMCEVALAVPTTGSCDDAVCAPVCAELCGHFASRNSTSQCAQADVDDLAVRYNDLQGCMGCCTAAIQHCGGGSLADHAQVCPNSCPSTTCENLAIFYRDSSRMFHECPDQLPPDLRIVVAQGSLNPAIMSQFQDATMNVTELGMPADAQECIENLTRQFPAPTAQVSDNDCFQAVEEVRDMMNEFLRVLRVFEREVDGSHLSFQAMIVLGLVLLSYRMRSQFLKASQNVEMGAQEEEGYARVFRMTAGVLEEEAWEDESENAQLKIGFER